MCERVYATAISTISYVARTDSADDAAAGAAGAEELLVIKSAENMVCTGVCGGGRSESGWKAFKDRLGPKV